MLSFKERIHRIQNTSKIIYIEDMTIHEVRSIERIGKIIFVNTGSNLLFQDADVFTLEEACDAERFINKIRKLLII